MLIGSCHCGRVSFQLADQPESLMDCNCSICRRVGALWAHAPVSSVKISSPDDSTITYVHGDRTLALHTCNTCGCTTHWIGLQSNGDRMGVNCRMCEPADILGIQIRTFDGADTWQYLD